MNKVLTTALAAAGIAAAAGTAQAQAWDGNDGYNRYGGYDRGGGYYNRYRDPYETDQRLISTTCSGERGANMQNRLDMAMRDRAISPDDARRIGSQIDRLRQREAHECNEGDWGSARSIGRDYVRLRAYMDSVTGYQPRWGGRGW